MSGFPKAAHMKRVAFASQTGTITLTNTAAGERFFIFEGGFHTVEQLCECRGHVLLVLGDAKSVIPARTLLQ